MGPKEATQLSTPAFGSVEAHPSTSRWHVIGMAACLVLVALYAAAGAYLSDGTSRTRLFWLLAAAAVVIAAAGAAVRVLGRQTRAGLLLGWPAIALVVTILVGLVEPRVTQELPGTITITFAFIGLTLPRWRSLVMLPLGVAAFVVGGQKQLPGALPNVMTAVVMWLLVAEVPAWLISRLQQQSALLRSIAETDSLTGLLNRSTLEHHLSELAATSAVVVLDLDKFKRYNDRHGHHAGDELLVSFADAIRASVRKEDLVFRIGGDEFLLLVVGADRTVAEQVLDRLRRRWSAAGSPVDFSAGIATGDRDPLRLADEDMYADKRSRGVAGD